MSLNPNTIPVSKMRYFRSCAGILRWRFLALSMIFFALSLLNQGFYYSNSIPPKSVGPGYILLLFGVLGVAEGHFAWFANPALFIAWLFMGNWRKQYVALAFSLIAIGLALSFLLYRTIQDNSGAGIDVNITYGRGYVLWVVSMVLAFLGCVVGLFEIKKAKLLFSPFKT